MKRKNKKANVYIILGFIIIFLIGIILGVLVEKNKHQLSDKYSFIVEKTKETEILSNEYIKLNKHIVYLYGLEEVLINDYQNIISLKEYLKKNKLDKLYYNFHKENYEYGNIYTSKELVILECHNNDKIYIMDVLVNKNNIYKICDNTLNKEEIIKTYKVLNIVNQDNLVYLIIKDIKQNTIDMVTIDAELIDNKNISINNNYDFYFNNINIYFNDNYIKNTFANANLVKIEKSITNKVND